MIKTTALFLGLGLAGLSGGCQAWHKTTPVAHKPAATQNDLAAAPQSEPVAPPVITPPANPPVAVAPATSPASTAPALMPRPNYVAADADLTTRLRDWPISTNYYANGSAVAGPVYRIEAPPPRSNRWDDVYAEDFFQSFVLSPAQMIATPIWMLFTHPNTPVVYHGETFPPSYNVDNPLPYQPRKNVPGIAQMQR